MFFGVYGMHRDDMLPTGRDILLFCGGGEGGVSLSTMFTHMLTLFTMQHLTVTTDATICRRTLKVVANQLQGL